MYNPIPFKPMQYTLDSVVIIRYTFMQPLPRMQCFNTAHYILNILGLAIELPIY